VGGGGAVERLGALPEGLFGVALLKLRAELAAMRGRYDDAADELCAARRAGLSLDPARAPEEEPAPPTEGDPADELSRFGLTGREREVPLLMVAARRSNPEIAQALFISAKTASVHVSNILAKLGVSGRAEAAAVAHRLGFMPQSPGLTAVAAAGSVPALRGAAGTLGSAIGGEQGRLRRSAADLRARRHRIRAASRCAAPALSANVEAIRQREGMVVALGADLDPAASAGPIEDIYRFAKQRARRSARRNER
jgi:DNA-binding CsgD family transcriptional regulator